MIATIRLTLSASFFFFFALFPCIIPGGGAAPPMAPCCGPIGPIGLFIPGKGCIP